MVYFLAFSPFVEVIDIRNMWKITLSYKGYFKYLLKFKKGEIVF